MPKLTMHDMRSASIMRFDPDTATAYETWIKSFLDDLQARYKGHGVHAEIELNITLKDRQL